MRSLIYLSTFYPPQEREYFMDGMHSAANISASAFSYSVLSGLSESVNGGLYVINIPLTGPYPVDYNKLFTPAKCTEEYGLKVKSVGSCNLYAIQGLSISCNVYNAMARLDVGSVDILIYSIQLPLLKAAIEYKKKNKGSRIIMVVPDLYENINSRSRILQCFKNAIYGDFNKMCKKVDGYVLLTKQMLERMPVERPYCVVEGIYNPSEQRIVSEVYKNSFTVLYTGMLYEKFGVKNLVDAICSLDIPNINLVLCGSGDLEVYVKEKAKKDTRIKFMGIVPREKVLELQCNASLLVNPRQPNGDFTRYSFPSKNIEYLASGTPTLLYELEGIPQEYFQYCYHLSDNQLGIDDLASMIRRIYETPYKERSAAAKKAQEFIFAQKNAPAQCEKIIQFIDKL